MNLIQGAGIRFGELSRALVKASRKMQNPVLIELTRGRLVESTHCGAIAVVRADGEIVAGIGDTARPVFPRSAIKPLQAFPFLETGAVDRFGFGAPEIAIACASHTGTSRHTQLVAAMLQRAGLSADALGCGTHEPTHAATQRAMIRSGAHPSPLHHNCSGKHAAMLATAVHKAEPTEGYWRPDHPVQQRIRRALEDMTGATARRRRVRHRRLLGAELGDPARGAGARLCAARQRGGARGAACGHRNAHRGRLLGPPRSRRRPRRPRHARSCCACRARCS